MNQMLEVSSPTVTAWLQTKSMCADVKPWVECPVPHPSAYDSGVYLLSTYDAASDKSIFSQAVVSILESSVLRDQLEHFLLGFQRGHRSDITRYAPHLRKYRQLYTAIITTTGADSESIGELPLQVVIVTD